ncbi:MAG: hypothetical protein JXM73_06700 [Anaerolineae bacterium]|nr:hypothetical protein [Anaerolineae bacterium]
MASTLLLKMPESLLVTSREEGTVGLTGPVRPWFWAVLAPYYFPVFTIPLLLIKPVVSTSLRNVMDLLIGFTLAFHYLSTVRRGFYGQIDVKTMGRIFSTIVTLALNVVWLVIILCVVTNNYAGIVTYFKSSLIRALGIYKAIPQWWEVTGRQVVGQAWEAVKGLWE